MLHVLPNIPRKNHNAATSGVQADKRTAARSNTLQQIEPSREDALVHYTDFLLLLFRLLFPACLPQHGSPVAFSSPANVSVFTSDGTKGFF